MVMNTATRAQPVPGAGDDASSTMTGETKIVSGAEYRRGDSSASYIATSEREGTIAGREEVHALLKKIHTRGSGRVESEVEAKSADEVVATLDKNYMLVARVLTTEEKEIAGDPGVDLSEHPVNKIGLEDYAKKLALLPDFTEDSNTTIDHGAPNIMSSCLAKDQQERLVATLKKNERILIASGNALPPPAYGVMCDIDTQGHAPIKQRARRVPLRYLGKLYELLRTLLRAGLIVSSDSPWTSSIVIVVKKNGLDIRLSIDYKMVNAITAIMEDFWPNGDLAVARRAFTTLQAKVGEAPILKHFDRAKDVHVMLFANELALSTTLMQEHEGKLHPVRFLGRVFKDSEMNYHPVEKEFAVLLLPWHLIVERVKEKDVAFAQLLQSTSTIFVDLEETLAPLAPPSKGSPTIPMNPSSLYAKLPRDYREIWWLWQVFVDIMESPRVENSDRCERLPPPPTTTVSLAENTGMNNGVKAALAHGAEERIVLGDSRLAIQQSLGLIACRKESLMALLNTRKERTVKLRSVKYQHVVSEYNAVADTLATEAVESKVSRVILAETRKLELATLNRIQEVIYEPNEDSAEVGPRQEERCVHVLTGDTRSPRKTFEKFVRDDNSSTLNTTGTIAVMTRRQSQAKHVRFADEHSVQAPNGQEQSKGRAGVANERSPDGMSQDQPPTRCSHQHLMQMMSTQ
ncbi:hypothetical protein F441_06960 [Phytophthora nicotianae CJ01A1]|uniref:Reverse transcriptase/retrotransposon-derived protein RNase H-like domain-containing protein n=1 Tax=Phytophthora nicotianae CJ01A1 TaxID=1317063 RepID=W2X819_PHYNI|nr:hypothetical protein F441_06960 [Phytophthora nicotianae CJ01A1]